MREYRFLPLSVIRQYEPELKKHGVSALARGPGGFLSAYKRAKGRQNRLSDSWHIKRHNFIKRHLAMYRNNRTYRHKLALIAWAYMP